MTGNQAFLPPSLRNNPYFGPAKFFLSMKHLLSILLLACIQTSLFAQYFGMKNQVETSWSLGLNAGTSIVKGDVSMRQPGILVGLYAQKSLLPALDLRVQFNGGQALGLNTTASIGDSINPATAAYDSLPVYHNFRMKYYDISALLKINLNRLGTSGSENWELYALAGVGTVLYRTDVDALNANDSIYNYAERINGTNEEAVKNELNNLLDGTYETPAEQDYFNKSAAGNRVFSTMFSLGFGFNINVSERIGIGLEARYGFLGDDLLDGIQWNDDRSASEDRDALLSANLGFRINL
jgi:opacity protein-like surface antigen